MRNWSAMRNLKNVAYIVLCFLSFMGGFTYWIGVNIARSDQLQSDLRQYLLRHPALIRRISSSLHYLDYGIDFWSGNRTLRVSTVDSNGVPIKSKIEIRILDERDQTMFDSWDRRELNDGTTAVEHVPLRGGLIFAVDE